MTDPIFLLLFVQFAFFVFFAFEVMSYLRLQIKATYKLLDLISDFEVYEALLEDDDWYNDRTL